MWDFKSLLQPQHALKVRQKEKQNAEIFCEKVVYAQLKYHKNINQVLLDHL